MAKSKVTDTRGSKSRAKAPSKARATKRPKTSAPPSAEVLVGNRFLSGDGLVDIDRVTALFAMTKASLAQTLGFADDTLQRFSRASAPKTQQRLREMLEILTRVERWAGGMPQALGWYRGQGIPALGDQTAEALVKSDQALLVRRYLDGLAAGSFA
jgi:hypothetical protein